MKNEVSKILQDYQRHLEFAIEYLWIILPNIFLGLLIAVIGWWVIKIINHWISKFFRLRTYDPTLVQFVQDFINYALKVLLFVTVITQLGVKTSSLIAILGPVLSRVVEANLIEAGAFFEGKGAVGIHE